MAVLRAALTLGTKNEAYMSWSALSEEGCKLEEGTWGKGSQEALNSILSREVKSGME